MILATATWTIRREDQARDDLRRADEPGARSLEAPMSPWSSRPPTPHGLAAVTLSVAVLSSAAASAAEVTPAPSLTSPEDNLIFALERVCAPVVFAGVNPSALELRNPLVSPDVPASITATTGTGSLAIGKAGHVYVGTKVTSGDDRSCTLLSVDGDARALADAIIARVARYRITRPAESPYPPRSFERRILLCGPRLGPQWALLVSQAAPGDARHAAVIATVLRVLERSRRCDHAGMRDDGSWLEPADPSAPTIFASAAAAILAAVKVCVGQAVAAADPAAPSYEAAFRAAGFIAPPGGRKDPTAFMATVGAAADVYTPALAPGAKGHVVILARDAMPFCRIASLDAPDGLSAAEAWLNDPKNGWTKYGPFDATHPGVPPGLVALGYLRVVNGVSVGMQGQRTASRAGGDGGYLRWDVLAAPAETLAPEGRH
jgi:hypothetical protein